MTASELARITNRSPRTIRRLCEERVLPALKIKGRWQIEEIGEEELIDLVLKNTT